MNSGGLRTTARDISGSLAQAEDATLSRIVAIVDAMPSRGPADALLAPLRPRLARLHPVRPLRFTRLLFLPVDPLVLAPAEWRPEMPGLPRSALPALTEAVRAGLGSAAGPIDAAIEGRICQDEAAVARAGAMLWPLAARLLPIAPIPAGWTETGLPDAAFAPLARIAAIALRHAIPVMEAGRGGVRTRDGVEGAIPILHEAARDGAGAWTLILMLLAARVEQPETLLAMLFASAASASQREAMERAADLLLNRAAARMSASVLSKAELGVAAEDARKLARLLNGMRDQGASDPGRRRRVDELRRQLDESCHARLRDGVARDLIERLRSPQGDPDPIRLETVARDLRRLERAAKGLGDRNRYDDTLISAAAEICALPGANGPRLVDRVRLIEILTDSKAALRYLGATAARG